MIALVIPWSTTYAGGVSTVVEELSRQWREGGVAREVVVDDWSTTVPRRSAEDGAIYFRVGAVPPWKGAWGLLKWLLRLPLALWSLQRFLLRSGITAVNFHYVGTSAAGAAQATAVVAWAAGVELSRN